MRSTPRPARSTLNFTSDVYKRADGTELRLLPAYEGPGESQDAIWDADQARRHRHHRHRPLPVPAGREGLGPERLPQDPERLRRRSRTCIPTCWARPTTGVISFEQGRGAVLRQPRQDLRLHRQGQPGLSARTRTSSSTTRRRSSRSTRATCTPTATTPSGRASSVHGYPGADLLQGQAGL